jgi:hypothetical protein
MQTTTACVFVFVCVCVCVLILVSMCAEVLTRLMEADDDSMCAHTSVYYIYEDIYIYKSRGVDGADGGRRRQHVCSTTTACVLILVSMCAEVLARLMEADDDSMCALRRQHEC